LSLPSLSASVSAPRVSARSGGPCSCRAAGRSPCRGCHKPSTMSTPWLTRYRASTWRLFAGCSTRGLTGLRHERAHLGASFPLRCFQRLSLPDVATQPCPLGQLAHQWSVHPGPLVLGAAPRNSLTPTTDRDRTVSRRSEPSSRTALMGEQPNPWDRLQPQDATSRHRGAKPCRRCELLGKISLLSPG
jgi:hypothetical protein